VIRAADPVSDVTYEEYRGIQDINNRVVQLSSLGEDPVSQFCQLWPETPARETYKHRQLQMRVSPTRAEISFTYHTNA
jgi:hypothetical protein